MTVEEFKKSLDNWLTSTFGIVKINVDIKKVNEIISKDPNDYNDKIDDIISDIIILKKYIYDLESIIDENNTMMLFAETVIMHINSDFLIKFDEYVKWDLKLISASKRNELSEKLLKVYNNAKSRLSVSKSKVENLKSIIKSLEDMCYVKRNRSS